MLNRNVTLGIHVHSMSIRTQSVWRYYLLETF